MLKPLPIDWSAADASISVITFIAQASFTTHELAHMLDSLVRVSRRVEQNHSVIVGIGSPSPAHQSSNEFCRDNSFAHRQTSISVATSKHVGAQQSRQGILVLFAFHSASSDTFNSLFKVLFTFPSWYLFAIGLKPMFSFR